MRAHSGCRTTTMSRWIKPRRASDGAAAPVRAGRIVNSCDRSAAARMPTLSRFQRRVREKTADPWAPPVLLVAFGDSVTQGMLTLDEQAHEAVYHARFKRLLEAHDPLSTFSVINAGVGGQTAAGALALIERDVIRHQPDLTLVSFALNDAWSGHAGVSAFIDAMDAHRAPDSSGDGERHDSVDAQLHEPARTDRRRP